MQLLGHVSISVSELSECVSFYDAVMGAFGCEKVYETSRSLGYGKRCEAGGEGHSYLAVYQSDSANIDNARHWCFKAGSREVVDNFYREGLGSGGVCGGGPRIRTLYHGNYYAAFLLDPFVGWRRGLSR